jgi:hypothetical protein
MCPLLAQLIIGFFSLFLLRPFAVLMKKTRAVKQSIFLDVYELMALTTCLVCLISIAGGGSKKAKNVVLVVGT